MFDSAIAWVGSIFRPCKFIKVLLKQNKQMLVHFCFHHIQNVACSAPPGRNVPRTEISKQSGIATCVGSCRDPGSNRGLSDLRSDALPTELSRQWTYYVHMSEHRKKPSRLDAGQLFWCLYLNLLSCPPLPCLTRKRAHPELKK